MVISHNLQAMNTQRQYHIMESDKGKASERLSSGYRINRSGDDAAGLSISEKMRRQIHGLERASTNAQDGISLIQTAEGALHEVHGMLQRMNELCIQAANGTNEELDRRAIQNEIDQINREIDRISTTTKFNETSLLDGSTSNVGNVFKSKIHRAEVLADKEQKLDEYYRKLTELEGKNAGQEVSLDDVRDMDGIKIVYYAGNAGGSWDSTVSQAQQDAITQGSPSFLDTIETEIIPQAVNKILEAYPNTFDYLQTSTIGMGLWMYSDSNSDTMASMALSSRSSTQGGVTNTELGYQLSINLGQFDFSGGTVSEATRDKLEHTIIHEMVHGLMDEALTKGMLGFDGQTHNESERFPKWFTEGMAQSASGAFYDENDWMRGLGVTPTASTGSIEARLAANPLNGTGSMSQYGSGYLASMYLSYLASGQTGYDQTSLSRGADTILNKIKNGSSLNDVIKEYTGKNINQFERDFSHVGAEFSKNLANAVQNGTGGLATNSYNTPTTSGTHSPSSEILANANPNANMRLFKLDPGASMVYNSYGAGYDIFSGGYAGYADANSEDGQLNRDKLVESIAAGLKPGGFGIALHVGADAFTTNKIVLNIDSIDSESIGTADVNVMSERSATLSIEKVALAIDQVSTQRSMLGAYQNRLEYTIRNLDNVVENTTAAESRIRDADMAKEMMQYSKSSILGQAGEAMLAQANQAPQGVLGLLQ